MKNYRRLARITLSICLLGVATMLASPQTTPPAPVNSFWSMQHEDWPAFPAPPVEGLQMFALTNGWLMDDRQVNYEQLQQQSQILSAFENAYGMLSESSGGTEGAGLMFSGNCTGHLLPPACV